MENKKQTAVEWYWDKIKSHFEHDGDLFETATFTFAIAKEKEKQQIIDAHGNKQKMNAGISTYKYTLTGEQYYKETYGK